MKVTVGAILDLLQAPVWLMSPEPAQSLQYLQTVFVTIPGLGWVQVNDRRPVRQVIATVAPPNQATGPAGEAACRV